MIASARRQPHLAAGALPVEIEILTSYGLFWWVARDAHASTLKVGRELLVSADAAEQQAIDWLDGDFALLARAIASR